MEEVSLNSEPMFDECDEFDVENSSASEHDHESLDSRSKNHPPPTVGLEFDSFEEAYNFYNVYAKEQGFGIRVSNSWFRSRMKERYRAKLSCSNAGFKKKSEAHNPRPETRTGCPAMIVIRMVDGQIWRIVEVKLQHNHQVNPGIKRFYKSHKKMILAAREAQPLPDPITETRTIKLYRTALMDAGYNGFSNFVEGQGTSFDNLKYLELKEGDGHTIYNYFCRMKLTNPNSFYLFDIDDEGQLRNVFWVDARSRVCNSYFNDTVIIDTTCLANKYEIPLISFVGVNNHGQSVLLGCGFLGYEKVDNFVWIFNAWLKCMLGCPPHVVITDQCERLQTAVAQVFPHAHHCYSLQYIMQRVPEKLGGLKGYETIRRQLNRAVYESLKIVEFENYWADMIKQHGLGDNKWLQRLYDDRHLWVPVYIKDTFLAGMVPTKENEGLIAYFDGYVHKHTSFKEFIDKYDLALHRKNLKEAMAELESRKSSVVLTTRCNFELQLSKLYTEEIFKKFQSEVEGMYSCFNTRQVNANGSIITYIVKERVENGGNEKEVKKFEVLYETNEVDIRCICGLFNFKGYLCRHALNVLNYNGVEEVPSRYILERWKKDFKQRFIGDHVFGDADTYNTVVWHKQLFYNALPLLEEGAQSQEHYMIALLELEQLLNKFDLLEDNSL